MRKIITIALTTLSLTAQADVYVTNNKSGGEIVLTNRQVFCAKYQGLFDGYSYNKGGSTIQFCWTILDDMVQTVWEDGTRSVFPANSFTKRSTGGTAPARLTPA